MVGRWQVIKCGGCGRWTWPWQARAVKVVRVGPLDYPFLEARCMACLAKGGL